MCLDSDLFGDVIVTINDVSLWLDTVASLKDCNKSRREHYAQTFDVSNKIKCAKLDGTFYLIINEHLSTENYNKQPLNIYDPVYKIEPNLAPKPCPFGFHLCENDSCHIFIKRMKHEYSAERYAKAKKLRLKSKRN